MIRTKWNIRTRINILIHRNKFSTKRNIFHVYLTHRNKFRTNRNMNFKKMFLMKDQFPSDRNNPKKAGNICKHLLIINYQIVQFEF